MKKFIATLPALALVFALSSNASAADTVSVSALADMGLAGMEVMSDEAGLAIRGKGYKPGKMKMAKKPWSAAYGVSYAGVGGKGGEAGTLDGFAAEGKYMASGEHFSEAGKTITKSHELQVKGKPATLEIHTKSIRVFAGGYSSSSSL